MQVSIKNVHRRQGMEALRVVQEFMGFPLPTGEFSQEIFGLQGEHEAMQSRDDICCVGRGAFVLSMETVNKQIHPLLLCPSTTVSSIPLAALR
jgi:outer membrane biogenesis lipoprotein LolB